MPMNRAATMILALVMTAAYLALAVWGEGGWRAFTAHPALVGVAVIAFVQAVVATFSAGSLSTGEREDRSNRWVIAVFAVIGLADGYLPAWSDRAGFWVLAEGVRWPGAALFAIGGALRLWPVFVLGRRFSGLVAIQPGHELVTDGVYGLVRNPSYLGMLVMVLGWGLAFRSWVGVLLAALLIPPLIARIDAEERLLSSQFGAQYAAFKARTWRLIPWLY
jgi:protein-S-isoprenylcysteine O-methyltransferase Ste14